MKNSTFTTKNTLRDLFEFKCRLTFFVMLGASILHAQNFEWAISQGGPGSDKSVAVAVDAEENVYTTGGFEGTADFDPGAGTFNMTSAGNTDIFITKVNASGNLVWAKQIGGEYSDYGNSIALDGSGNVYTTGSFRDTIDFDPGSGIFLLEMELGNYAPGGAFYLNISDIFISKLDGSGNFVWANRIGGTGADFGSAITVDANGGVLTTGKFQDSPPTWIDTVDFDPGPGIYNLVGGGGFVSNLDASGNFVWAKQFGQITSVTNICNPANGQCIYTKYYSAAFRSIAIDASGNVLTTGALTGTTDFNPDAGTSNLTNIGNSDAFVCKLDNTGNFTWAKQFGGTNATAQAEDIALDGSGNAYTTGYFIGTVDFNPGAATNNLKSTGTGSADVFVSKLNTSGNYVWGKQLGGSADDRGSSIALDGQGNVYITGWFAAKADFDPGAGKYFLTPAGIDIFVSKLTSAGAFTWARKLGGTGEDKGYGIAIDAGSNVCTTGFFTVTADFDPNGGIYNLISAGGNDVFISKLNQGAALLPTEPEIFTRSIATEMQLYPNPAREKVMISFDAVTESEFEIILMDMTGRLNRRITGTTQIGKNEQQLIPGNIPGGIYQVLFVMDDIRQTKLLFVE